MFSAKWTQFRVTDSAQRILQQLRAWAIDRGLVSRVADDASFKMLALWSVLLSERKLGLAALEHSGGNRFDRSGRRWLLCYGQWEISPEHTPHAPKAGRRQRVGEVRSHADEKVS